MRGGDFLHFLVSFQSNLRRMLWTWSLNPNGFEQGLTSFSEGPDNKYFDQLSPHNNPMSRFGSTLLCSQKAAVGSKGVDGLCLQNRPMRACGPGMLTPGWGAFLGHGRVFLNPQNGGGDRILHLCCTGHSQVCLLTAQGLLDFLLRASSGALQDSGEAVSWRRKKGGALPPEPAVLFLQGSHWSSELF